MNVNRSNDSLLRRALLSDAVFEFICAVLFIELALALAAGDSSPLPLLFLIVGILLVGVAVLLFSMYRQAQISLTLVRLVMFLNAVFAIALLIGLIALWASLGDTARLIGIVIAAGLAIIAALEYVGLRNL